MDASVKGESIALSFKLEKGRPSSTGKSTVRYTTGGYVSLGNNLRVSVNVIEGVAKAAHQDTVTLAK